MGIQIRIILDVDLKYNCIKNEQWDVPMYALSSGIKLYKK